MRTTTIFAETHTSERANHVAYRLVLFKTYCCNFSYTSDLTELTCFSYTIGLTGYILGTLSVGNFFVNLPITAS